MKWDNEKNHSDIVLSTRIRLARNIKNTPFPIMMTENKAQEVVNRVEDSIINSNSTISQQFRRIEINKISPLEKTILVEKHLISPDLGNYKNASVFIRDNEEVSIMVNEEDHIRIQCILPSFKLHSAYDVANKVDDLLEEKLVYAFNEKYGYLTSCPTNIGTGMRASVMVHLPSLALTKHINNIFQTISKFGLTIRGIYGEGSETVGNLYQISNQITLGVTEEDIVNNLHTVVKQIIKQERKLRNDILIKDKVTLEDKIWRAYGTLKNARIISTEESMRLLSLVRLGVDIKIIKDLEITKIDGLMTSIQPGILSSIYGREFNSAERDHIRAQHIREKIN